MWILQDPAGRYIVLYTFIARDENDVSVERGEFVTVLNREDPDWYWIVRSDGQEGFVPSGFVYPADVIQGELGTTIRLASGQPRIIFAIFKQVFSNFFKFSLLFYEYISYFVG